MIHRQGRALLAVAFQHFDDATAPSIQSEERSVRFKVSENVFLPKNKGHWRLANGEVSRAFDGTHRRIAELVELGVLEQRPGPDVLRPNGRHRSGECGFSAMASGWPLLAPMLIRLKFSAGLACKRIEQPFRGRYRLNGKSLC